MNPKKTVKNRGMQAQKKQGAMPHTRREEHYEMPGKKTFLLDIAIGRYFLDIGDFRTRAEIMRFFRITPKKFNERAKIIAGLLDAHGRREVERVLFEMGRDSALRMQRKGV